MATSCRRLLERHKRGRMSVAVRAERMLAPGVAGQRVQSRQCGHDRTRIGGNRPPTYVATPTASGTPIEE